MSPDRLSRLALLGAAALALSACSSIRDAAGVNHRAPDEFAVATKAPLIIPPDFNLKPPRPGAPATNQPDASEAAQAALFGQDPAAVARAMPAGFSEGEKLLLAYAGAAGADHSIRKRIDADNTARAESPGMFGGVFGGGDDGDQPVDADAEKQRIDDAKAQGTAPGSKEPAAKPGEQSSIQKDSGWLDGIF